MSINSIFKVRHKNIHFVGVGGIGMSGIAKVLINLGFSVSGSDIKESEETKILEILGAKIYIGHNAKNIENAHVLVFSSAILESNEEIIAAKKLHIPLIPRALMLAEIMRLKCGIAVLGAHGKTTTTSLIGTLMHKMSLDPTVIIGGIVNHFGTNAIFGQGEYLVAEADESDGSFSHLSPTIAVLTNIDAEHLDYYKDGIDSISKKFAEFVDNLPFYGLAVGCYDDYRVRNILEKANKRVLSYGISIGALYRASNIKFSSINTTFDLLIKEEYISTFTINMIGIHNVLNTLAAIIVLQELGIKPEFLIQAISDFSGVKRRFSLVGKVKEISVIDDYAHHPTEIKAVIDAARLSFKNAKIRVLFQPHRYSRTKELMDGFIKVLLECDSVVVTDIYAAQESPILGIDSKILVEKMNIAGAKDLEYIASMEEGAQRIVMKAKENDLILTMGAGNINTMAPKIVELLSKSYEAANA